jgi:hypothetical protein
MRFIASVLLLIPTQVSAQILVPQPDRIVISAEITLSGESPPNVVVSLNPGIQVGQQLRRATMTAQDRWEIHAVKLDPGLNTITVNIDGKPFPVVVTRAEIVSRPPQEIFFQWRSSVDVTLQAIAAGTLDPPPSAAEQVQFAADVMARTEKLTIAAFAGVGNVLRVSTTGANTHTVRLSGGIGSGYGQFDTTFDCLNSAPDDFSRVFVGYVADRMINDLSSWLPMNKREDCLAERVEDVAQVLARTTVHEIAHSLGLVGDRNGSQCQWMRGSDAGHTIPDDPPGVTRHGNGLFVMDEVPAPHFRLGYLTQVRTDERLPIVFCDFNRSYLGLLLP